MRAHIHTYMVLYELALEQFFKYKPDLKTICSQSTDEVEEARTVTMRTVIGRSEEPECVRIANDHLLQVLTNDDVVHHLKCGKLKSHQMLCSSQ